MIRPCTDAEWDSLPHATLTSDTDWDPFVLDNDLEGTDQWQDALPVHPLPDELFDEFGNYRNAIEVFEVRMDHPDLGDHLLPTMPFKKFLAHDTESDPPDAFDDDPRDPLHCLKDAIQLKTKDPDFESLRPCFGWQSTDAIACTWQQATTQFYRIAGDTIKKVFKSPFPAMNVVRRHEAVATDTVFSDTPAIDCGYKCAQIYTGVRTKVTDIYGMKSTKNFPGTLQDQICERGAPDKLVSDNGSAETSSKTVDILRHYHIKGWHSEAYQQHQNPMERRCQDIKRITNRLLDRTNSPPYVWLLALAYVCFLLNRMALTSLGGIAPLQSLTGQFPDISPLLCFRWMEKAYFTDDDAAGHFPSRSKERLGYFVGFAEHVGHHMTFKVLAADANKVLCRSRIRSAEDSQDPNPRAAALALDDGEESDTRGDLPRLDIIKSCGESISPDADFVKVGVPIAQLSDLLGRTFPLPENEHGERSRAKIVELLDQHEADTLANPQHARFRVSINNDTHDDVISHNKLLEMLSEDEHSDVVWKFKQVIDHQGPISPHDANYKGSSHNIKIEWEDGSTSWEPISVIIGDCALPVAEHAEKHKLLDTPGWKRLKKFVKNKKKFTRMINQAKLRSFRASPRFKYGFEIPKNFKDAVRLDQENGNTKWQDAIILKLGQIDDHQVFIDHGEHGSTPQGYKKITVHLVFDAKHDGRHKARLVAGGHLTEVPVDSVYSGVVSLRRLRVMLFLAELNDLETWSTDIGNACLEAVTQEKLYIIAGPEFGDRAGHKLVIHKALCGLRTSGLRWHDRFSECLQQEGFFPCKAEPDVWIRRNEDVHEYVAVCVNDLAFAMKNPKELADILTEKHGFKLKGTGPISFHLGCDFFRDDNGVLCMAPKKYVDRMVAGYKQMFGELPSKNVKNPLEKGDHPELGASEFLDADGITKYQSLIGSSQWAVSLGRFDIATAVMTLSSFRSAPRRGHLERAKRIVAYLCKMKNATICFRTREPDYSDTPIPTYDWAKFVCGDVSKTWMVIAQNLSENVSPSPITLMRT